MKKICLIVAVMFLLVPSFSQGRNALLVIDIQNFYFPGGRSELVEPVKAADKAAEAIKAAREKDYPVIFIQHKSASGMEIHDLVKPATGEAIFIKEEVNCFHNTGLGDHLKTINADTLIICGMQTHMCVEAAVRAAHDLGYGVILLHDACATRNLKFGDREVLAADVHSSTLATLRSYAKVISVQDWMSNQ